jgi:probable HAF family extracellular repeat protein
MQGVSQRLFRQVGAASRYVWLGRRVALVACVCGSVLAAVAAPAAASTYSVTDLGSLGYGVTKGLAINNSGQVTGYSYSSDAFQVTCPPQKYGQPKKCFENPYHAFLWSSGTMTDLGTFGGHFSQGVAINLAGEVVGSADKTSKDGAYLGSDGFLWNGTKMVDLGFFEPGGINDSGQIAGGCGSSSGCVLNGSTCGGSCVLSNGKFTQLPDPPGENCGAGPINNNGVVLGGCDNASSYMRGVVWENGTPIDLGTLGGPQTGAAAINNLGQVVGWSQTSTDNDHPFLWSNGKMTDLGVAPCNSSSATCFFPAAINDNGVIVGGNEIYSAGKLQDLNTLIPAGSPYQIQYANAINNNGQIVADAYDTATYQTHALLLTPN